MINQVLSGSLSHLFTQIFVNFSASQLEASLFTGSIKLNNMQFTPTFGQQIARQMHPSFNCLLLVSSMCKELTVSFSVLAFKSKPVQLEFKDVALTYAFLAPQTPDLNQTASLDHSYESSNAYNIYKYSLPDPAPINTSNVSIDDTKYQYKFEQVHIQFQHENYSLGAKVSQLAISSENEFELSRLQLFCFLNTQETWFKMESAKGCFTQKGVSVQAPDLELSFNSESLKTLQQFWECLQLQRYRTQLSKYTPVRRPSTEATAKKRKLIVRDWFHWVVWYVRLRDHPIQSNPKFCLQVKRVSVNYLSIAALIKDLAVDDSLALSYLIVTLPFHKLSQKQTNASNQPSGILSSGFATKTNNSQIQSNLSFGGLSSILNASEHTPQARNTKSQRITLVELSSTDESPALEVSRKALKIGHLKMNELHTEQILKSAEQFAPHFAQIKWPYKVKTLSIEIIKQRLSQSEKVQRPSSPTTANESFSSDCGDLGLEWALQQVLNQSTNFEFNLQQLSIKLYSESNLILKANCLEPCYFYIKKDTTETTLMLGQHFQMSFTNQLYALRCLVQSLNTQLQPFLHAVSQDQNLDKIKQLYRLHKQIERSLNVVQKQMPVSKRPQRMIDQDIAVPLVSVHDVDHTWPQSNKTSFITHFDKPSLLFQQEPSKSQQHSFATIQSPSVSAISKSTLSKLILRPRLPIPSIQKQSFASKE